MGKQTAKELMEDITNFVNTYSCDKEGFKQAFKRQHCTLQQSTMRLFLELIEDIADDDDFYVDGRNEATKKVSKDLIEGYRLLREKRDNFSFQDMKPSRDLPLI